MIAIKRKVEALITPSVGEIVEMIWSMDAEEQAQLICRLAGLVSANHGNALMQMAYITDELDTYTDNHRNNIGQLFDDFNEYFSKEALRR